MIIFILLLFSCGYCLEPIVALRLTIVKFTKILIMRILFKFYYVLTLAVLYVFIGSGVADRALGNQKYDVDSYIVVDLHSKKILSAREINKKRQVASLTKIATAIVVLDWAKATGTDLGQYIIIPQSAADIGGPNQLKLRPGDQISIRDALYCSVLGSNNWTAEALAYHVGKDLLVRSGKNGDFVKEFVKHMNALANDHGLKYTKFVNPHGMDHQGKIPYSSASDVARLTIYAMGKAAFSFICSQTERKVSIVSIGSRQDFIVKNTNKILNIDGIDGVKTGLTSKAGPCLVVTAAKQPIVSELADGNKQVTPRRLVVVVLGASDRFGAARSLLLRGWEKFEGWNRRGRQIRDRAELLSMSKE